MLLLVLLTPSYPSLQIRGCVPDRRDGKPPGGDGPAVSAGGGGPHADRQRPRTRHRQQRGSLGPPAALRPPQRRKNRYGYVRQGLVVGCYLEEDRGCSKGLLKVIDCVVEFWRNVFRKHNRGLLLPFTIAKESGCDNAVVKQSHRWNTLISPH